MVGHLLPWPLAVDGCLRFDRAFACLYNSDSVTDEKITSLLGPFLAPDSLSPDQLQNVKLYLDLLLKWNAKVNLTAIRSEEEVVTRHFGESFFAARELAKAAPEAASAADVGSGAGFPGLPIKLWLPEIDLTLIESNQKKAAFLREASRTLELDHTEVKAVRAEQLSSKYEIVTLRAVEQFERVLPVAFGLLAANAVLGLLIGSSQASVAKRLLPSLEWNEPIPIPNSDHRIIFIGRS